MLFNDGGYSIAYGRTGASQAEVEQAARKPSLTSSPERRRLHATMVGERDLKLGRREAARDHRRARCSKPLILIFDRATSALDSANERAIQAELRQMAQGETTLVIAHRLSTVVDAREIVVMGQPHRRARRARAAGQGGRYASMWAAAKHQE